MTPFERQDVAVRLFRSRHAPKPASPMSSPVMPYAEAVGVGRGSWGARGTPSHSEKRSHGSSSSSSAPATSRSASAHLSSPPSQDPAQTGSNSESLSGESTQKDGGAPVQKHMQQNPGSGIPALAALAATIIAKPTHNAIGVRMPASIAGRLSNRTAEGQPLTTFLTEAIADE